MNKIYRYFALMFMLFGVVVASGCSSDSSDGVVQKENSEKIEQAISAGSLTDNGIFLDSKWISEFYGRQDRIWEFLNRMSGSSGQSNNVVRTLIVNLASIKYDGHIALDASTTKIVKFLQNIKQYENNHPGIRFKVLVGINGSSRCKNWYYLQPWFCQNSSHDMRDYLDLSNAQYRANLVSEISSFNRGEIFPWQCNFMPYITSEDQNHDTCCAYYYGNTTCGASSNNGLSSLNDPFRSFDGVMIDIEPSGNQDSTVGSLITDLEVDPNIQLWLRYLMQEIRQNNNNNGYSGQWAKTNAIAMTKYSKLSSANGTSASNYYYMGVVADILIPMLYDTKITDTTIQNCSSLSYNIYSSEPTKQNGYTCWVNDQAYLIASSVSGEMLSLGYPELNNQNIYHLKPKIMYAFPTYSSEKNSEGTIEHYTNIENITSAALGVIAGLQRLTWVPYNGQPSMRYVAGAIPFKHLTGYICDDDIINSYGVCVPVLNGQCSTVKRLNGLFCDEYYLNPIPSDPNHIRDDRGTAKWGPVYRSDIRSDWQEWRHYWLGQP